MNPKHIRVWPLGEYPSDSIDLVNERGEIVISVSSVDPEDGSEPTVHIDDKCVRIIVEDSEITKEIVDKALANLSGVMNVTWLYVDSDEKLLELIEKAKTRTRE